MFHINVLLLGLHTAVISSTGQQARNRKADAGWTSDYIGIQQNSVGAIVHSSYLILTLNSTSVRVIFYTTHKKEGVV